MTMNTKKYMNEINNIPMPSSINYMWNMGSLLGMTLLIQMLTGIMISFHYTSFSEEAFNSVINLSRNVNNGWIFRNIHINGASMFFIFMYIHISKNILIKSYKMIKPWNMGVIIVFALMATAFLGYILPWGQMSFWAATVITNLMSAVPIWGNSIVMWLWGGFSVSGPTLTRFFSLHFLLPFLISFLSMIHIIFIHHKGSSNPISVKLNSDKMNFHPFFSSKDLIGVVATMMIFFLFNFINPFISTDPENFIPANPMITPIHIQPEWYFLFAYAILRSIPNKLGGVIALVMSILILSFKSMTNSKKMSYKFEKKILFLFAILTHTFLILTWIGMKQVESPFIEMGMFYSFMYFLIIILI